MVPTKLLITSRKIRKTTENEITSLNKKSQIFSLPNNSSPYNIVNNNVQKNNVAYSQKQNITNIS